MYALSRRRRNAFCRRRIFSSKSTSCRRRTTEINNLPPWTAINRRRAVKQLNLLIALGFSYYIYEANIYLFVLICGKYNQYFTNNLHMWPQRQIYEFYYIIYHIRKITRYVSYTISMYTFGSDACIQMPHVQYDYKKHISSIRVTIGKDTNH